MRRSSERDSERKSARRGGGAPSLAILSATHLPQFLGRQHPSEESLFAEDELLIEALDGVGFATRRVSWRDHDVAWDRFDLAVIRSTWDYIDDLPQFLKTLGEIEACGVRLINPLETVRWNCDKRYLNDLMVDGVRVVPTLFLGSDATDAELVGEWFADDAEYVVKPTVGVGSFNVRALHGKDALIRTLASASRSETLIVQPFIASIVTEGEWSFVFGAGEFLYAVLKKPAEGDFRVQVMYGATIAERTPSPADLDAARQVYESMPVPAHIARIDMVRLADGGLALMEAELIEPQLHLFDVPSASAKIAAAVRRIVAG